MVQALRIEPLDGDVLARAALLKSDTGNASRSVDQDLLQAARINPLDSELQMTLGLRAEFRGDNDAAERYLAQAAAVDHGFKPAWTLASFCYRTGRPEKFWPMARRCLNLQSVVFDPSPIFDLCWKMTEDFTKIPGILPQTGSRPVQYLSYLVSTGRFDVALGFVPAALNALDNPSVEDLRVINGVASALQRDNRAAGAVAIWNGLVLRKLLNSGSLDPVHGRSIADPDFAFPAGGGVFSWQTGLAEGLYETTARAALRIELDGNEPESLQLLSVLAPVLPNKAYRLVWEADPSQLVLPLDPGFGFQIAQDGKGIASCQPLLPGDTGGSCNFSTPPLIQTVNLSLKYARTPGTTRARGLLRMSAIRLEFAP